MSKPATLRSKESELRRRLEDLRDRQDDLESELDDVVISIEGLSAGDKESVVKALVEFRQTAYAKFDGSGLFCGDSPAMQGLVGAGLMALVGRKSFVPDPYFRITAAGAAALKTE